jgi:hypothetical protein
MNTKDIQGIIRDYFENIYWNNLENPEEMDSFVHTYEHPKLNQVEINHRNRSITWNEIGAAFKSLPNKKVKYLMDSPLTLTRPLKKN